jgi:hypothetical protein
VVAAVEVDSAVRSLAVADQSAMLDSAWDQGRDRRERSVVEGSLSELEAIIGTSPEENTLSAKQIR